VEDGTQKFHSSPADSPLLHEQLDAGQGPTLARPAAPLASSHWRDEENQFCEKNQHKLVVIN